MNLQAVAWWHVGLTDDVPLHDESVVSVHKGKKATNKTRHQQYCKKLGQELKLPKYLVWVFILVQKKTWDYEIMRN